MRTHRLATGGTVALEPTRSTASAAAAAGFGVDGRSPTRAALLMAHEAATVPAICPLPSIEPPLVRADTPDCVRHYDGTRRAPGTPAHGVRIVRPENAARYSDGDTSRILRKCRRRLDPVPNPTRTAI